MAGEDRAIWLEAMRAELNALAEREVYDEMTTSELNEKCRSTGIRTKKVPAKLVPVQKPLHDGWKAKA